MYSKKVKLRFVFIIVFLILIALTTFTVLKVLKDNVVYFKSPSEISADNGGGDGYPVSSNVGTSLNLVVDLLLELEEIEEGLSPIEKYLQSRLGPFNSPIVLRAFKLPPN